MVSATSRLIGHVLLEPHLARTELKGLHDRFLIIQIHSSKTQTISVADVLAITRHITNQRRPNISLSFYFKAKNIKPSAKIPSPVYALSLELTMLLAISAYDRSMVFTCATPGRLLDSLSLCISAFHMLNVVRRVVMSPCA